jgi:hypothetical protein
MKHHNQHQELLLLLLTISMSCCNVRLSVLLWYVMQRLIDGC